MTCVSREIAHKERISLSSVVSSSLQVSQARRGLRCISDVPFFFCVDGEATNDTCPYVPAGMAVLVEVPPNTCMTFIGGEGIGDDKVVHVSNTNVMGIII